jgi:hypothetical protein
MNDLQLYGLYLSIPLTEVGKPSRLYPNYVKITGKAFSHPHPHRHYSFNEFVDKLESDSSFKDIILNKTF